MQTFLTALLGVSVAMHLGAGFWNLRISLTSDHKFHWYVFAASNVLLACSAAWMLVPAVWNAAPLSLEVELSRAAAGVFMLVALIPFRSVLQHRRQIIHAHEHLLQTMRDTYYRADQLGIIEVASASCETIIGYSAAELVGRRLSDFYVDPAGRAEMLQAMLAGDDSVVGFQSLVRHRDGRSVMLENNAHLLRNAGGEIIGVEGVLRDITGRVRAEQQSSELGRILESSVNEIFVFDAETRLYLMVNKGARENVGYTMDELRRMTATELRPGDSKIPFEEILEALRRGEATSFVIESQIRRKNGSLYPAELTFQYSNAGLRPVYFVIVQDITERQKVAADLAQAQRLQSLGQLTGGMAHDFNNLLQALQLSLDMITPATPEQVPWHDGAQRVILQASRLTQRLLAFARHQTLLPKVVDVGQSLAGLEMLLRLTVAARINLLLDLNPQTMLIEVDESQLENALLNLVLNAREAMPRGGQLRIRSQRLHLTTQQGQRLDNLAAGPYVKITLTDNGKGMSSEVAEKSIEPFFTTKQAGEGSGLGLSMVYGFAKQSGGHMTVSSVEGRGTKVCLYFPESSNALAAAEEQAPLVRVAGGTEMILLLEDDEVVGTLVASLLTEMGYAVVLAADGPQAELAASRHLGQLDLVISDVLLSDGASGPLTVARIKAIHGPLKTIFISGHTRQHWSAGEVFPNDSVFLHKPFTRAQLGSAIRTLLGETAAELSD